MGSLNHRPGCRASSFYQPREQLPVPYTFYGTNSNAAAYAVADMAVKADGGKQGTQAVPGNQYHPGDGAYRQVEGAAQQVANQQHSSTCASGGATPCR